MTYLALAVTTNMKVFANFTKLIDVCAQFAAAYITLLMVFEVIKVFKGHQKATKPLINFVICIMIMTHLPEVVMWAVGLGDAAASPINLIITTLKNSISGSF